MRRVLFLGLVALLPVLGWTAERPQPKFLEKSPDQVEGARVLHSFRNVGIQGDYWLQFELRVLPRRGPERLLAGELFGRQGRQGPLTRLRTVNGLSGAAAREVTYLLENGENATAWKWNDPNAQSRATPVADAQLLAPLEQTDLTLFDLQMPFLRWTDFVYEGVANVRGRPAHAYLLYPPQPLTAPAGEGALVPAAVRVYLDTQFNALTQAEWLDGAGKSLKTVTVLDLKKSGEQWLVKSIDLRNTQTRDKTRFSATAVALDMAWPASLFSAEHFGEASPLVPQEKIERL